MAAIPSTTSGFSGANSRKASAATDAVQTLNGRSAGFRGSLLNMSARSSPQTEAVTSRTWQMRLHSRRAGGPRQLRPGSVKTDPNLSRPPSDSRMSGSPASEGPIDPAGSDSPPGFPGAASRSLSIHPVSFGDPAGPSGNQSYVEHTCNQPPARRIGNRGGRFRVSRTLTIPPSERGARSNSHVVRDFPAQSGQAVKAVIALRSSTAAPARER